MCVSGVNSGLKLMLMLTGMSNTFTHTHQTEQDVSLAAVSKDLRLVTHRYTHMYACERTFYSVIHKHTLTVQSIKIHTDLLEKHVLID